MATAVLKGSLLCHVSQSRGMLQTQASPECYHSGRQFKAGHLLSLGGKRDGRLGLTEMVFLNDLVSNI